MSNCFAASHWDIEQFKLVVKRCFVAYLATKMEDFVASEAILNSLLVA